MAAFLGMKKARNKLSVAAGVLAFLMIFLSYCSGGGGGGYGGGGAAPTYIISGATTSGSAGLAGVAMTLSGAGSALVDTDVSGNYSFSGLANGSYTITPAKTGFTFTPSSSAQTVSNANITNVNFIAAASSAPTFSMSGTITISGGGTGVSGVAMTLSGAGSATATTDASGNYVFSGLASGSYTITPAKTGFTFTPPSSTQTINGADLTGVDFTATAPVASVQVVACPGSGTTDVSAQFPAFNPTAITISSNTIVKWTNLDSFGHTVTSDTAGIFDSALNPGTPVCLRFLVAGTYSYHCTIHPGMTGTVTVQ